MQRTRSIDAIHLEYLIHRRFYSSEAFRHMAGEVKDKVLENYDCAISIAYLLAERAPGLYADIILLHNEDVSHIISPTSLTRYRFIPSCIICTLDYRILCPKSEDEPRLEVESSS